MINLADRFQILADTDSLLQNQNLLIAYQDLFDIEEFANLVRPGLASIRESVDLALTAWSSVIDILQRQHTVFFEFFILTRVIQVNIPRNHIGSLRRIIKYTTDALKDIFVTVHSIKIAHLRRLYTTRQFPNLPAHNKSIVECFFVVLHQNNYPHTDHIDP